jgi:hypothetical protein
MAAAAAQHRDRVVAEQSTPRVERRVVLVV